MLRGTLARMHHDVLHRMRKLAMLMQDEEKNADAAAQVLHQICNECRKIMGSILEIQAEKLHCCVKVMLEKTDPTDPDRVATWVRSDPRDLRPLEFGAENAHSVKSNSVWSSMFGVNDSQTNWQMFNCFACNDLTKHAAFRCDRKDWQKFYKSALVFPIRYEKNAQGSDLQIIGFIAFDSPDANAFHGLPNIYEHLDSPTVYLQHLTGSTAFHVGAIFADTLGTLLGPVLGPRHGTISR